MNATDAGTQDSAAARQPHPSPHRHRVLAGAVWFGLLGAPLGWSLQELVNVSLAGYACYPHDTPLATPLWTNLNDVSLGVEAAAAVLCVGALIAAVLTWRRTRHEKAGDTHQLLGSGDGRTRFMAMAGMITSALFLVATGLAALNLFGVPPCGG
jgi:Na+/proline symporter